MEPEENGTNAGYETHAIHAKAFRKYGIWKLVKRLCNAVSLISFIWIGLWVGTRELVDAPLEWAILIVACLLAASAFFRFFLTIFALRRSVIYTMPSCVIFCKRVWRPYSNARYIAYRIDHITKQIGADNEIPSTIKGNIQAVYLDESGQPVSPPRLCRKVEIPPVFAGKEEICQVLGDIESATDRAKGRSFLSWLRD